MDLPLHEFVRRTASKDPTPGGGSVAALVGALGAALGAMVCHLTIGKPRYAEHEAELIATLAELDGLRARLLALMDADIAAYEQLSAAYKLPREPAEPRAAALAAALGPATEVPLRIAEAAAATLDRVPTVIEKGSVVAVSDAGMAALLAAAALASAKLNVLINLGSNPDAEAVAGYRARLAAACDGRAEQAAALYDRVVEKIQR